MEPVPAWMRCRPSPHTPDHGSPDRTRNTTTAPPPTPVTMCTRRSRPRPDLAGFVRVRRPLHHRYVPVATRISAQHAAISTIRSPTVPDISSPWTVRTTRMNVAESSIRPTTCAVAGSTYTEMPSANGPDSEPWRMTRVVRSGDVGGMTDMTGVPGSVLCAAAICSDRGRGAVTGSARVRTSW
nr:hypothetical protein [Nonomuraea longispora]